MTPDEQTATMLQVSLLLREPDLREEYLLVSADLALYAKDRGSPGEIDSFMQLMIAAADQSAFRAAFISAKRFLDGYESRFQSEISRIGLIGRCDRSSWRSRSRTQDFPSRLLYLSQARRRSVWSSQIDNRGRGQGESKEYRILANLVARASSISLPEPGRRCQIGSISRSKSDLGQSICRRHAITEGRPETRRVRS